MAELITPFIAFILGAALARANNCAFASSRRLVVEGKPDWLLGLVAAAAWAGLTMTAMALALPHHVLLPAQLPLTWRILLGGVILGVGATVNQGCFLGSLTRLGRGDLTFLFTLAGIASAMVLARWAAPWLIAPRRLVAATNSFRPPDALMWAGAAFLPPALYLLWRWRRRRRQTVLALMVIGIAGGAIYAFNPNWSYCSGIFRVITQGFPPGTFIADSSAVAVFAGVAFSARLGNRFAAHFAGIRAAALRFIGGMLLGAGALLVPGATTP